MDKKMLKEMLKVSGGLKVGNVETDGSFSAHDESSFSDHEYTNINRTSTTDIKETDVRVSVRGAVEAITKGPLAAAEAGLKEAQTAFIDAKTDAIKRRGGGSI